MSKTEGLFSQMLLGTGVLLPVEVKQKGSKVSAMCRLVAGKDKEWTICADKMLRSADAASVDLLVCRRFLLKNGEMVQGIYICLEGKASALPGMIESISKAVPKVTATEPAAGDKESTSAMSYSEYRKMTSAPPRKMSEPGRADPAPPGFRPEIKILSQSKGSGGRVVSVEEIPIPHIHREMNVPNNRGRGAKLLGG